MPETTLHRDVTGPRGEQVFVRRSARRRRTVSISRREGDLVIAIPASFSARQERQWVTRMIDQMVAREQRATPARRSDAELARLAAQLGERYLEGRTHPTSVTWSTRQNTRWGSCTSSEGTIRLSHRLQDMPQWVIESVLMHELCHLLVPDHGPAFQELMNRYPRATEAKGFLDGVTWAQNQPRDRSEDSAAS
ncbi:MAG TPA: M48 family metallopeptidase [Candidatus Brachybacterium merdigallinarum]|nr:M48 family metallopeptidase [Candidatus Brachybacterium merdigallinarum]